MSLCLELLCLITLVPSENSSSKNVLAMDTTSYLLFSRGPSRCQVVGLGVAFGE